MTTKAELESRVAYLEKELASVTDYAIDEFMKDWNRGGQPLSSEPFEMCRMGRLEACSAILQNMTSIYAGGRKNLCVEILRWCTTGVGPTLQVKAKKEVTL